MKNVYIVSDVHGDHVALRKALYRAGVFDNHGKKDPNAYVVQIGDLANCVKDSVEDDLRCLGTVGREVDLMLIGNHEIPYFDAQNRFHGFFHNNEIRATLHRLRNNGLLMPCYVHEQTLISHAGISLEQMPVMASPNARDISLAVEKKWVHHHYHHAWFSDIGRARYGDAQVGGLLWCDFQREFEPTSFPQIVGHTARGLQWKGNSLCIDTIAETGLPTVLKLGAK